MDSFPEDFSHSGPLLEHVSALQEVMDSAQDLELLELVSSDSLLVEFCYLYLFLTLSSVLRRDAGCRNRSASLLRHHCVDPV